MGENRIEVERETDAGYQIVRSPLPALLTTALTFGEPRYASLKGIMGAKKKPIAGKTLADLSLDVAVGTHGSKTELRSFAPPPVRGKGRTVEATDGSRGRASDLRLLTRKAAGVSDEKRPRLRRTSPWRHAQSHLRDGERSGRLADALGGTRNRGRGRAPIALSRNN